ncbi:MAG: hypothetical protein WC959_00470 [Kiritimatiellales bacterium]
MKVIRIFLLMAVSTFGAEMVAPEFKTVGDSKYVLWKGQPILELFQGRTLRFRATPENDHWVGDKSMPNISMTQDVITDDARIGLTWGSRNDPDYKMETVNFVLSDDGFTVTVNAHKTKPAAKIISEIKARYLSDEEGFEYILRSTLNGSLSEWRAGKKMGAKGERTIEPFNYHLQRISMPERLRSAQQGESDLYMGFVRSPDGKDWIFTPKMHVPAHPIKTGFYPLGNYQGNSYRGELPMADVGSFFGILDPKEGGWMTEVLESPKPLKFSLCWMFFDVHCYLYQGVPESAPDDILNLSCAIRFSPVTPQKARELLNKAEEYPWKELPEYQLPVFSRYNTFSEKISSGKYGWLKSDFDCLWDKTSGYDDHYSISIKKEENTAPSAWYGWFWGPGYELDTPLDGVYRISARIKTRDCTGVVRMGINEGSGDNWFGREKPGKWSVPKCIITYADQELTGTTDWTLITIDVPIDNTRVSALKGRPVSYMHTHHIIFFEQSGSGQCWIDNVRIQQLEDISE